MGDEARCSLPPPAVLQSAPTALPTSPTALPPPTALEERGRMGPFSAGQVARRPTPTPVHSKQGPVSSFHNTHTADQQRRRRARAPDTPLAPIRRGH